MLAGIVAVGAVLRVVWALKAQQPGELRDPVLYLILGDHVAAGDGFTYGFEADQGTSAYYPPGYPVALGGVAWLVRLVASDAAIFDVAIWFNVVLSVATIGLVFVLARRVAGDRAGLAAAAIWALWPNLVFHSGIVLTETLFLFLLVALLIVLLGDAAAAAAPGRARLVVVGVLFGLTLLVRPVSVVMAPVLLVLWWGRGARAALGRLALVGGVTLAVLVPWSVRSTLAMDAPVLMSLNFGDNLCLGHNPGASGGFGDLGAYCYTADDLQRPESETRRQSENIDLALTYIREHPGTTLSRTPSKLRITLQDDYDGLRVAEDFGARPLFSSSTRWAGAGRQRLLPAGGGGGGRRRRRPPAAAGPGPARAVPGGRRGGPADLAAGHLRRRPVQDAHLPHGRHLRRGGGRRTVGTVGRCTRRRDRAGRRRGRRPGGRRGRPGWQPRLWGRRRCRRRR